MQIDFVFSILILIVSVIIHEVSHGYAAYYQGDNTAKFAGRLTLNPIKHLELFGSFVLPVISYLTGGFIIGWAKPVPFNPYNLRNQRWGEAIVAFAGPLSNIAIATVFGLSLRYAGVSLSEPIQYMFGLIVYINLVLATFNLVPIPPLDGSKIVFSIFPNSMAGTRDFLEKNGLLLMLVFVFFLWQFISPVIAWEFRFITGFSA